MGQSRMKSTKSLSTSPPRLRYAAGLRIWHKKKKNIYMAHREAFISLKDQKENFENNPKCRLIDPAQNSLVLISKQILDSINNT